MQDHSYIALSSENPVKVSAFEVTLEYTNSTTIQSVNMLSPFTSFSNIQNEKGRTKVVGFVENPETPYLQTTLNRLAEIVFIGENKFNITVEVLEDFNREPIPVNNLVIAVPMIIPQGTLPPYNIEPVRQSPMEVIVIKLPAEQGELSQQGLIPAFSPPSNGSVISTQTTSSLILRGTTTPTGTGNVTAGNTGQPIPAGQISRENGQEPITRGKGTPVALPLPVILFAALFGCIMYVTMKKKER